MPVALQLLRFAINLAVTMLLARILTPADFGLYGMALTVIGLLLLFRDGGVESAMLHHERLTADELASLASLNTLFGLALAAVCAVLAPLLAAFYHEPRLLGATLLFCTCFLGYGLDVQPGALLLRGHRFETHAKVEVAALAFGLAVALLMAAAGAGYWALFTIEVTTSVAMLAGHWRATRWRPRFSRDLRRVAKFIRFGRDVSLVRILGHVGRNIDNVLVGLLYGPAALAIYSKAVRLTTMPQEGVNWPLTRVAIPTLSRLRNDSTAYVAVFRRLNLLSAALGMPWAMFFMVSADAVVRVVYGAQWSASAPLLRFLGVMGLCNTFLLATVWIYTSAGTVNRQVRWEVLNTAGLALAFLVGLHWGIAGMAVAASAGYVLLRLPALSYCFHGTAVRLRDLAIVLWRPTLAAGIGGGGVVAVRALVGSPASPLGALALDGVVLTAGYGLGWVLVPGWGAFLRRELRERPLEGAALGSLQPGGKPSVDPGQGVVEAEGSLRFGPGI